MRFLFVGMMINILKFSLKRRDLLDKNLMEFYNNSRTVNNKTNFRTESI